MKKCSRCGRLLAIDDFPIRKDNTGRTTSCPKCLEHVRQWRLKNLDRSRRTSLINGRRNRPKYKTQRHEYYLRNRDSKIAHAKSWKIQNPERVKKTNSKSYLKHRDKISEKHRDWRMNNRSKMNAYASNRRAKIRGVSSDSLKTIQKWISDIRGRESVKCYWCDKPLRKGSDRTLDHITPIKLGGAHRIHNFCVSCLPCNQCKNAKTAFEWSGQGHLAFTQ